MKKILITGANSYIGTSFEKYMSDVHPDRFLTETLDMRSDGWREKSFNGYDAVFHVAGIAHADVEDVTEETKQLYYKVNTDLAVETAQKAKEDGVKQFVFMSSMIVYGQQEHISYDTKPAPSNFYGDSKWKADQGIRELQDQTFITTVVRPPMIYGRGSKGNYPKLAKLAARLPIFPKVHNKRSMLYIDNLCEFIFQAIENNLCGIFFPQNDDLVNTSELVSLIAKEKNHKIIITPLLNPAVWIVERMPGRIGKLCKKAFGNSFYDLELSDIGIQYRVVDLKESIRRTEN